MRQRAVLAGGDDRRERRGLGAEAAHRELEVERDVALGAPGEAAAEHLLERVVGQLRGGADRVELGGVLDRAQLLDDAAGGGELDAVGDELGEPRVLLDATCGRRRSRAAAGVAGSRSAARSSRSWAISRSHASSTCSADWVR